MNKPAHLTAGISQTEKTDRLRLIRSENVGPVTYYNLMMRYGSAGTALDALPELAQRGGLKRRIRVCSRADADRECSTGMKGGATLLTHGEKDYPPLLGHLDDAPPVLWCKGHSHLLNRPSIAIVGSRNASAAGLKITGNLARELGELDYLVTSGLARGIDGAAHTAALPKGTCAVLAGGVDQIYPPQHDRLYHQIAEQGVLLSEMPVGLVAQARHFPRRNRLVSGMSLGILVVEAALRSGSLITARLAIEQNRTVFAIPGSPLDQRSSGTNDLIRKGAHLVESATDIVEVLAPMEGWALQEPDQFALPLGETPAFGLQPTVSEEEIELGRPQVLSLLGPVAIEVDELIRLSERPPSVVLTVLIELELAGRLERQPGQKVALIEPQ